MNDTLNEAATPDPGALARRSHRNTRPILSSGLTRNRLKRPRPCSRHCPWSVPPKCSTSRGSEARSPGRSAASPSAPSLCSRPCPPTDAADVFRHLGACRPANRLLAELDPETRTSLAQLLIPRHGRQHHDDGVRQRALDLDRRRDAGYIRKVERTRETVYAIYVLDPRTQAAGAARSRCAG